VEEEVMMGLPNAIIIKIIQEVHKSRAMDLKAHKEKMEKRVSHPSRFGGNKHSLMGDIMMWKCPSCRAKSFMHNPKCFKCGETNPEKKYTSPPP
tara:strand:- start:65 stop:346 length:282 start_codon:yes stop_codon:yes gene_type:complete